jgi:hypothetical protein
MANRTIPLRNAQSASRKTAPKPANGRHVNGPRVNGKALRGKPKIPGAQFIAREQILPFGQMVFGLVDPYDRGIDRYVDRYARVLLAWRRSKSWVTGRYICMNAEKDGSRRAPVQTQGWDETGTKPKHDRHMEFEWYDLGPKDLLAVEIGVFHACEGANNFKRQVWPDTYQALAAPEPDKSGSQTRRPAHGPAGMSYTLIRRRRSVPRHGWRASKSRAVSGDPLSGLFGIYGRGSPSAHWQRGDLRV